MSSAGGPPTVVLVVEDEALVRMFAADLLREEGGFKVFEAGSADEALIVLEATSNEVQAVVTDVEMPGTLDGFTLARIVTQAWPHIGNVVVSGRMAPGPGVLPHGARFLAKPYRPAALIEAVHAVLSRAPRSPALAETAAPVLPTTIKTHQLHTGVGSAGGLAQPLTEPEE
jgi:two-component system, response regulator PdtaR